jgi:hypothetical protein
MAYESERSYFLSTITQSTDTSANQTFVYNIFTRTWVRWTFGFSSGIVEPGADKMYFAKPSSAIAYVERKEFTDDDYADPEYSCTITSISGETIEFTTSGAAPQVGFVLYQAGTGLAIESVTSISGGYRVTMESAPPASWAAGAATIYPSVGFSIEWQDWTFNNPDILKQVRQIGILADSQAGNNSVTSLVATFRTNFDSETDEVTLDVPSSGWGSAWGSSPWGGGDSVGYPTYVPRNKQYCTRMALGVKHKNARERIAIAGCCFSFESASDRIGR